jgi:hypothetical protein
LHSKDQHPGDGTLLLLNQEQANERENTVRFISSAAVKPTDTEFLFTTPARNDFI